MHRKVKHLSRFTLLLAASLGGFAATASSQERIGVTATVRNVVSQIEPRQVKISVGDEVIRDEVVRTAADSDARFVLRDNTNLSLGPGSTLRLDRAVFSGDVKAGDIAIKLTTGTFRFVTGDSKKEAYVITTPIATMGVRGTTLDLKIDKRRNVVVLRAGLANVCVPGKCVDLIHVGDSSVITANGTRVNIEVQSGSSWTFDNVCNGGLCGTTTFAQADQNIITGSITPAAGGGGSGGPTAPGSFPSGGGGGGGGGQTAQGTPSGGGNFSGGGVGGGGGGSPATQGITSSNSPSGQ